MIIQPKIKLNIHMTTHPMGLKESVKRQINHIKEQEKIKNGPKVALIVGSSSGYGLATRISLAFGAGTKTIGVSTGGGPRGKRTGKAGFWNTKWFNEFAKEANIETKDFVGDAFSHELKQEIVDYIKTKYGKLDLLVYSLASGIRINPDTKEKVRSALKPIGKAVDSFTVDIATMEKQQLHIGPATQEEIDNTVYTMGGGDWNLWIKFLKDNNLLAEGFKTIAYSYIGGEATRLIYRDGTIGKAKEDLEKTAEDLNDALKNVNGNAYISVSKAIVTKASAFIPSMIVYGSALFEVSLNAGLHETVLEHKFRLFKDMIYGDNILTDGKGRIRLDSKEMNPEIQAKTLELMKMFDEDYEAFKKLEGTQLFIKNFYRINGFNFCNVDYSEDIDIESL